ncbi:MAG: hypothetical protein KDA61_19950 [Planctomycetales bacterium]|nr:hypothetical protein [Planctomycetales bacterium]
MSIPSPPTTDRREPDARQASGRAFPLIAVLQLVTAVAAGLACIDFSRLDEARESSRTFDFIPASPLYVIPPIAIIAGIATGAYLGALRRRPFVGIVVGGAQGACCGGIIALASLAPAPLIQSLCAAATLVVATIVLRWHTL